MSEETKQLQKENKLLRTLGTRQGFFNYYFEMLPQCRTNVECFNHVNDLHLDLFGEYRYETYNSFRQLLNYNLKIRNEQNVTNITYSATHLLGANVN